MKIQYTILLRMRDGSVCTPPFSKKLVIPASCAHLSKRNHFNILLRSIFTNQLMINPIIMITIMTRIFRKKSWKDSQISNNKSCQNCNVKISCMGKYYSMLIYMSMEINAKAMNMDHNCQIVVNFHIFLFSFDFFLVISIMNCHGLQRSKRLGTLFFY